MCVTHHGDEQVEHKQCGNDGKDKVDNAKREGQVHIVVGGPIDDAEEKLEGAEQSHGVVIEIPQIGGVLRLENDIECCPTQEEGTEMGKHIVNKQAWTWSVLVHSLYLQHVSPYSEDTHTHP